MQCVAKRFSALFAGVFLTVFLASGGAQAAFTPAQVLDYTRPGDLHFSPDGKTLAYTVMSYPRDWKERVHILDIATGKDTEITPAGKEESQPIWSPDGKTLAFLSDRGDNTQVYLMLAGGGSATALTAGKKGVSDFAWSPDGKSIAYTAKDDTAPSGDDGPQIADDERQLQRLWVIDIATKKSTRIGKTGFRIHEMAWRDSRHILLVATDKLRAEEFTDAVYEISVPDGAITKVGQPPQPFEDLTVSPDGKQFAVRSTRTHGPEARDLFVGTIGGNDLHDVSQPVDRGVVLVQWHDPSTLWMSMEDGFHTHLYKMHNGAKPEAVELPLSLSSFDVTKDGSVAYVGKAFDRLDEIYLRTPDGKIRQLTHLATGPVAGHLAPTTLFHTKSFDGTDIEAALVRPIGAKGKLPLVLLVHGGPSSRFIASYYWEAAWAQLLASHGYEVLMVNPRGSSGYSEAFLKANRGDWGGGDYKDLMAVLDAVIAKGETDPNRIGIGGWSYGGEMSEWAPTQTHRFKAAVVGAGVFNQAAEFETEHNPAGDEWYFGTPWEQPDMFARHSPSTYIRNNKTPTLIFDGEADQSNPPGQSKGLYRALKHFGVDTQLVLYPGEGHSPDKGSYNIDMFQRLLDWYDRYLGKKN